MKMKNYMIGVALALSLTPTMMQSEEKKTQQVLPGDQSRQAMLKERIENIRQQIKDNELVAPTQAQDALVTYLVTQFELLFSNLADRVADVVRNILKDESAAVAIKKLPGALADGALLSYYLIAETISSKDAREKYLKHLVKVRNATKCLLAKNGALCDDMPTQKEALIQLLANLGPFIKPLAAAIAVGIKTPDGRKIEGMVVQATNIIAPQLTPDVKVITELFELIINFAEQAKTALEKPLAEASV
jgi:hypothetical protein